MTTQGTSDLPPSSSNQNADNLIALQNQTHASQGSTYSEWAWGKFSTFQSGKRIWKLAKIVSPDQTIRAVANLTINPLANALDRGLGTGDAAINIKGYKIPCSFSTFGSVVTEGLSFSASPAQWVLYKAADKVSTKLTHILISKMNLNNGGSIEKEIAGILRISSVVLTQKGVKKFEEIEIVNAACKAIDKKAKPLTDKVNVSFKNLVDKGLDSVGISTTQPLRLTREDIKLMSQLVHSEMIQEELKNQEDDLQKQKEDQQADLNRKKTESKIFEDAASAAEHIDADALIKKAREYEKNCPEKGTTPNYDKDKAWKSVYGKFIAEKLGDEFGLTNYQREKIITDVVNKLDGTHGEKEHNKCLKTVINEHKANILNNLNHRISQTNQHIASCEKALHETTQSQNKVATDLKAASDQYEKDFEEFEKNSNEYQQEDYQKQYLSRAEINEIQRKNANSLANILNNLNHRISQTNQHIAIPGKTFKLIL